MHTSEPGTQLPQNSVRYNVAVTARQAILEWEGVPDGICRREPRWEPKLRRTREG